MNEFFRDESFWIDTYPFLFSDERIRSAEDQVEKMLALARVEHGRILDLCCGPGRHAVWLARKGFEVTGVDISSFLLDKARERARDAGVAVEWVQEDMRRFVRPGAFDFAVNFFTSFGLFDDRDDDEKVLQNMFQCLRPGGACLLDMMGRECLAAVFHPTNSECLADGTLMIQRSEVFDDWGRARNEWILIKDGKAKSYLFDLNLYTGRELREKLLRAGFEEVTLYGDLEGNDYDNAANRLIALARRGT